MKKIKDEPNRKKKFIRIKINLENDTIVEFENGEFEVFGDLLIINNVSDLKNEHYFNFDKVIYFSVSWEEQQN